MKTRWISGVAAVAMASVFCVFSSSAADRFWNNLDSGAPLDGSFGVAGNWDPEGVPGDDDRIILNREAATAYTIELDQTRVLDNPGSDAGLEVRNDDVILDLNSYHLTLNAAGFNANILLGAVSGVSSTLEIIGGGTLTGNNMQMGEASGATLTVKGQGTVFDAGSATTAEADSMHVGYNATSHVRVEDGGKALLNNVTLAYNTGAAGSSLLVTGSDINGTGSELALSGRTLIRRAAAYITVEQGGRITGTGSMTFERGSSIFKVDTGGTASTGSIDFGKWTNTYTIDVQGGGELQSTELQVARNPVFPNRFPKGNVNITGSGSTYTVSGNAYFGHALDPTPTGQWEPRTDNFVEYWLFEANLSPSAGGEFNAESELHLHYSSTVTIDGGIVRANTLNVVDEGRERLDDEGNPWKDADGNDIPHLDDDGNVIYDGAEYILTLREDMIGTPAPFRVEKDESEAGGNATLRDGKMVFTLVLADGYTPSEGDVFGVLSYEGTLSGYFRGLQPNSTVTFEQDAVLYELDYGYGINDAITLTVIPEPHTLSLLLAAGALLALRRRA